MSEFINLIQNNGLAPVISYFVYGAIFLAVYHFVTFKNSEHDKAFHLISCITVSFIIKILYDNIINAIHSKFNNFLTENSYSYYVVLLFITIIAAYMSGIIMTSKTFNKILLRFNVKRTTNKNIWPDVIKKDTWLCIHIRDEKYEYLGAFRYAEEGKDNPKFVLSNYRVVDHLTKEVKTDYADDDNRRIVIDTKNVDIIEVIYT